MNLAVFHPENTNLIAVIDAYHSLRWRRKFFEPGEFELHLPAAKENINILKVDYLLHYYDANETGMIEAVSIKDNDLTVSGRMLSCCLDYCYIDAIYNFYKQKYGQVMATLVKNHGKSQYTNPRLSMGNVHQGDASFNSQISHKNLLSVLVTLSKTSNIGFRVFLNPLTNEWVFETYTGVDRSIAQSQLTPIIFSDEYGNLSEVSYQYDKTKYRNHALVLGEGEGESRTTCEVDTALYSMEPRRYLIVDAKDIRKEEGMTDDQYSGLLFQRGLNKLAESAIVENFDANTTLGVQWEYRKDWNLGDIVTIESNQWGISINRRITEVEEIAENGVLQIIPTFGTAQPETLDLNNLS